MNPEDCQIDSASAKGLKSLNNVQDNVQQSWTDSAIAKGLKS
jgi:hypothetical protein